jgi:hypothetical protein
VIGIDKFIPLSESIISSFAVPRRAKIEPVKTLSDPATGSELWPKKQQNINLQCAFLSGVANCPFPLSDTILREKGSN